MSTSKVQTIEKVPGEIPVFSLGKSTCCFFFLGTLGFQSILVGGIPTPLKNDGVKVNWENDSQYMEK